MAKKASSKKPKRSVTKKASKKKVTTKAKSAKKAAKKTVKKSAKKAAKKTVKKSAKKAAKKAVKKSAKKTSRKKLKSPLTRAELRGFRRMLAEKRRDIVGDMSGIEAVTLRKNRQTDAGDLSSLPTHPADIGSDNYEQEFTLGLLESERALLDQIDEALGRINDGTFGICIGTGKVIGKARLKARPWAKYCIEYARMIEKGLIHPEEDNSEI